jgi:hypothetical protein
MKNLGYDNRNLFSSLGTLSFLILLYFFRVFIAGFLKSYIIIRKVDVGFSITLYSLIAGGLFFNYIFSIYQEGMMVLLYNAILNY